MDDPKEMAEYTCVTIYKEFPRKVKEGDIIVAGKNFGCGSSRETAPAILQRKGIKLIVAESFARIFYRSSFARALILLEVEEISKEFKTGEEIEINIPQAEVINLSTGLKYKGKEIHPILLHLIKIGGLEKKLLRELK
jgi:3-isopropylmalate/(R)-2-methylmalate dehydratase small subunit